MHNLVLPQACGKNQDMIHTTVGRCGEASLNSQELEAGESSISPLVRPYLPPLVVLVIALSRLLEGKAPVEREREEARSQKPVLERSFHKGRAGKGFLNHLRFDESEVIDPQ